MRPSPSPGAILVQSRYIGVANSTVFTGPRKMISWKQALLGSLVLVLAVLAGWLSSRFDGAGRARPEPSPTLSEAAAATPTPRRAGPIAELRPRPRSERTSTALASPRPAMPRPKETPQTHPTGGSPPPALPGAKVEFRFAVTKNGRFAPTAEAVKIFDCVWSSRGEEPIETLYDRIAGEIRAQLPKKAEGGAIEFFDAYVGYRQLASRLTADVQNGMPLSQAYEKLHNLRRQTFGDELAERLFGAQEEAERAELEILDLTDEPVSNVWEQVLALKQSPLIPAKKFSRQEILAIHTGIDRYVAEADSPRAEKKLQKIAEVFPPGVLDKVLEARRSRSAFATTWRDYWDARRKAETTAGVNCEGRAQLVEDLRGQYFSPEEAARVKLLDSIEFDRQRPQ